MPKSPEVLADRAQDLTQKLGYSGAIDRAYWIGTDANFTDYLSRDPSGKNLKYAFAGRVWPSPTVFWFRESPQWMMPAMTYDTHLTITPLNPPYESKGMVTLKLDMAGRLLFLRAIPSQLDVAQNGRQPDWNLLFAKAGLDKSQFVPGAPKWAPPDRFDASADWDGYVTGHRDVPLHVTAAAWRGQTVYFQVIAPWDKPWQMDLPDQLSGSKAASTIIVSLFLAYVIIASWFARRNFRRGRADVRGAVRFGVFVAACTSATSALNWRFVPIPAHVWFQFYMLGIPLTYSLLVWVGYIAVEPYARRMWPEAMVSWQRLLNGRMRDPLIGRDVMLGILAGSGLGLLGAIARTYEVDSAYGRGVLSSIGRIPFYFFYASFVALLNLAILSALTGLFRRRWLGILATGIILVGSTLGPNPWFVVFGFVAASAMLLIQTRVGLLALAAFIFTYEIDWPPLNFSQWYAGVAMIPILFRLALLFYAFWVSLGGQPIIGRVLEDE